MLYYNSNIFINCIQHCACLCDCVCAYAYAYIMYAYAYKQSLLFGKVRLANKNKRCQRHLSSPPAWHFTSTDRGTMTNAGSQRRP